MSGHGVDIKPCWNGTMNIYRIGNGERKLVQKSKTDRDEIDLVYGDRLIFCKWKPAFVDLAGFLSFG